MSGAWLGLWRAAWRDACFGGVGDEGVGSTYQSKNPRAEQIKDKNEKKTKKTLNMLVVPLRQARTQPFQLSRALGIGEDLVSCSAPRTLGSVSSKMTWDW